MGRELVFGGVLETGATLPPSPFLLTGGSTLFYFVEVAFANSPGDATYTWTDITAYCRTIDFSRGRQKELNSVQAGTASISLLNLDRRFEPAYAASPYYPNVVPVKPIRVRMVLNGTEHILFTHFVERWPEKRQGATYAEQDITTVDGFEMLSNTLLPGATYPQEPTGTRIGRVLTAAGWPLAMRNLSTGASNVQSYTFTDLDAVNALQHIQDCETAEGGLFFIAGNGNATFLDRNTIQAAPYNTSQAILSDRTADVTAGTAAVAFTATTPSFDKDLIVNDFQVVPTTNAAYPGLVEQEALDSTSEAQYFTRSQQLTVPLTTNADTLALAQYLVLRFKQPLLRHDSITFRPGSTVAYWQQALQREIGDRVTVIEHPPGGGIAYDADERIQWVHGTINLSAQDATWEWATFPATGAGSGQFLVLDDATNGVLDATNAWGY